MNTKSIYCIYPWDTCDADLSAAIMAIVANHNSGRKTFGLSEISEKLLMLATPFYWELDDEEIPTELKISRHGLLVISIKMHPVCEIVETPQNQAE